MRNPLTKRASAAAAAKTKLVPVFPKGAMKFDPLDFWLDQFDSAGGVLLEEAAEKGDPTWKAEVAAGKAGEWADAALVVAEARWGMQGVK